MTKSLREILRRSSQVIVLPLSVVALLGSAPVAYYGVTQKNEEYKTMRTIEGVLSESGMDSDENIATIMGMVRKESLFYEQTVGRGGEAGILQLTPETAQHLGLRVKSESLKSSGKLQKLFYLGPGEDITKNE